jgi:hypothetical protein
MLPIQSGITACCRKSWPFGALFKFEARQTAIIVRSWLLHLTHQVQIFKKMRQNGHDYLQQAVMLHGWAVMPSKDISGRFFKGKKPTEEIIWLLFLMNMIGLTT